MFYDHIPVAIKYKIFRNTTVLKTNVIYHKKITILVCK